MSGLFLLLPCFIEIPLSYANSVDKAQMARSVASELCLHYLPMFLLRDARHKWVKVYFLLGQQLSSNSVTVQIEIMVAIIFKQP